MTATEFVIHGTPLNLDDHPGLFTRRAQIDAERVSNTLEKIPEPEVANLPVDLKDERVPRGCRTIANVATRAGFEVYRLTYARGPWMHSSYWTVLRIAESIVLGVRHPDGRRAVAAWLTDGHGDYKAESAHLLTPALQSVTMDGLKEYLRR